MMKLVDERYEIRTNVKCMRIVVTINLHRTIDNLSLFFARGVVGCQWFGKNEIDDFFYQILLFFFILY